MAAQITLAFACRMDDITVCSPQVTTLADRNPLTSGPESCIWLAARVGPAQQRHVARAQVARVLEVTELESSEKLYRTRVQVRNGDQLEERQVRLIITQTLALTLTLVIPILIWLDTTSIVRHPWSTDLPLVASGDATRA